MTDKAHLTDLLIRPTKDAGGNNDPVKLGKEKALAEAQHGSAKPRAAYLDLVRVTALLCVIMMHTGIDGITPSTGIGIVLHQAFIVLLRIAIPLFFMTSGALLLGREEDFKTLFTHRILRFCVVILLIQAVQYLYMFRKEPWKMYLQYYMQIVYSGEFAAHTWYLYSYLAFLFMLPFLRKLAANMDRKHFHYMFAVYLFYQFVSSLGDVLWGGAFPLNCEFSVSFFLAYDAVIYPLAGYYLHNVVRIGERERSPRFTLLCWAAAVLALTASVGMRILSRRVTGDYQFDPYTYILIPAAIFFFRMRVRGEKPTANKKIAGLLAQISRTSFGTYLLHNIYLDLFAGLKSAASVTGDFVACLLLGVATLAFGTAVSFVLKAIPGLKELI